MQIREIWPFLLPGVLLQLFMQTLCIVEGVRDNKRKPLHRILYILSIAAFGLAVIAFHLLRAEKTPPKDTTTAEVERANHLTNKGIFLLLLISYQVMGLHMLTENAGTPVYMLVLWLLTISFVIMLLYNLLPEKKRFITEPFFPCCNLSYVFPFSIWMFLGTIYSFLSLRVLVQLITRRYPWRRRMGSVLWALILWVVRQEQCFCPKAPR